MKHYLTLFLFFFVVSAKSQTLYFPPTVGNTWDTISPLSLGWCPDKVDTLLDYLEDNNTKAFILLKDGKIVIEHYFGTFTQDSLWYWASAGKTITSFMTGIAQQENYLSISDTTSDYLGQGWTTCTTQQEEKITIRNQLTMTSGLDDAVPDHYCTLDTCLNYLADAGTRWAYHNGPYTLLDGVIENATGQTLNAYTTLKLKTPTGMTGNFYPSGYNNIFVSKPRSMARFGLLILNNGNWNGNQIMTDATYFNDMVNTSQQLNKSYGYLWWLNGKESFMVPGLQFNFAGSFCPHAPDDMIAALGKNGQFINVVPSQNLVYIRMGNSPGTGEVPIQFNDTIWIKLNELMCNTISIDESNQLSQQHVFPNPAQNTITIEFKEQKFGFRIFDFTGKEVYSEKNCREKVQIDCSAFANGIYYVQLQTDKGSTMTKFIVSH
jgi:CubicO group peptidase (beta-lactamase class C family)